MHPDEPGIRFGGLPYRNAAAREGGPGNGVLTAVEDFVAERDGLRLAIVPAFFGLGIVWATDAPYAAAVAEVLDPWDATRWSSGSRPTASSTWPRRTSRPRTPRCGSSARNGAGSCSSGCWSRRAFALAERLSRLRHRAGIATEQSIVSRDEIRRALDD